MQQAMAAVVLVAAQQRPVAPMAVVQRAAARLSQRALPLVVMAVQLLAAPARTRAAQHRSTGFPKSTASTAPTARST
ncbi:hypothetical protein WJ04_09130 [Burkholderia vietnamiensis]|nr:hypothetical protein WJ04_09130 [Burkholderia vietnamiensis]